MNRRWILVVGVGVLLTLLASWRAWTELERRDRALQRPIGTHRSTSLSQGIEIRTGESKMSKEAERDAAAIAKEQEALRREGSKKDATEGVGANRSQPVAPTGDAPDDAEFARYDQEMNRGVPLAMIGIPQSSPGCVVVSYQPTPADEERTRQIDAELARALRDGRLNLDKREGYVAYALDRGRTLYVRPDFLASYERLGEERSALHRRNLRPAPAGFDMTDEKTRTLSDGSILRYYRRRDGALVRSVIGSSGTRKWVIGWADLSQYSVPAEIVQTVWKEE